MSQGEISVSDLWRNYKDSSLGYEPALGYGDFGLRNKLLISYGSLVRYVASRVAVGLPPEIPRDDLVSWGTLGLIDAITKFDPDRGNKFETYAVTRIRGEIVDHLRGQDHVPRSVRTKAKALASVVAEMEVELGRAPRDTELAARLDLSMDDTWKLQRDATASTLIPLDEPSNATGEVERPSLRDTLRDISSNPEDLAGVGEIVNLLAAAVDQLPERAKTILVLYYLEEMTLAGIGDVLGVTESRVCQLQGRLLEALKESLAHGAAMMVA